MRLKVFGFTLIELMVTIGIIAVVMGVGTATFDGAMKSSRDGKRKSDIESIRTALELYRSDKSRYPGQSDWIAQLQPTYIAAVPTDPRTGANYSYTPAPAGCTTTGSACTRYTICADLERVAGACDYVMTNP